VKSFIKHVDGQQQEKQKKLEEKENQKLTLFWTLGQIL
jgi:hypothetical protein